MEQSPIKTEIPVSNRFGGYKGLQVTVGPGAAGQVRLRVARCDELALYFVTRTASDGLLVELGPGAFGKVRLCIAMSLRFLFCIQDSN